MADHEPTAQGVGQALVSALATLSLILLFFGLVLPMATVTVTAPYESENKVSIGSLWTMGMDHGFSHGGGAKSVTYALLMLLALVVPGLLSMWTAARMYAGGIGPTGARVAVVSSVVLLVGVTWTAFRIDGVWDLTLRWATDEVAVLTPGPGLWLMLAGATTFAAATLPGSVRSLWIDPSG